MTGPDVIKAVTGEDVTAQELGGAAVHNARSGVAHLVADDERPGAGAGEAAARLPARRTTPRTRRSVAPYDSPDRMDDALNTIVPRDEDEPYDMRADHRAACSTATASSRCSRTTRATSSSASRASTGTRSGIVANQPAYLAGALDIDSSDKIARFVRICDAFNMPIVTFVDTPGYLPGVDQEHCGDHPARREGDLRLLRGDGAEDLGRHAQGDRRRVPGDELEADAHATWRSPGRRRRSR